MRERIIEILRKNVEIPGGVSFSVEHPPRAELGDYATNLPLVLAGLEKKQPQDVAEMLMRKIIDPAIATITFSPPGFLNFQISESEVKKEFTRILDGKERYGNQSRLNEKIQVEFISANPTGPLTLANGRGGFLGDVLSRVLASQGFEVEREYYINDSGNQITTLGLSILAIAGKVLDDEKYYHGDYLKEWLDSKQTLNWDLYLKDPQLLGIYVANDFVKNLIRPVIEKKMKINFDRWTSEQRDIRQSRPPLTIEFEQLAKSISPDLIFDRDGARWLKTKKYGDDKDRVLVTSDRLPTYFFIDAAHYLETKKRGFNHKINILGADHHGYVSRIQAVAKIIGMAKSEVIVMQLVRLMENGVERRMSKRTGVYVTIDELIDEVGLDQARYFFLEKNHETHIDFDLDLAKKRSKENPVFYIQYAHARLCSIFIKEPYEKSDFDVSLLASESEDRLIWKLIDFPDVLRDIAADYRVSRLIRYAYELAHNFHVFYETERILDAAADIKKSRLQLARATQIVLKKSLDLLGISAPEEM
ncbi:MAG: arginine--tRNA ligase [Candidatus Sungbacteria bacterium]|uniref:Arginine--tRNA ligase n=1 Tax=Candidatus Sungiibacteriota bacterium TaxID=2750080 RepID=A0A9D6QVR2_9BACT|nr:arginine--tRNA ligase [Candidatus Sungbacteria bacterium]